jgi:toxin secretion/phage lysis holin
MRIKLCLLIGAVGSAITTLLGGWDSGIATLCMCMVIDYMSGLTVAGVFHRSPKTENGRLESRAGQKGLSKKLMTLALVAVATRADLMIGTNYIRDALVIAFVVNEILSIIENATLMGIKVPDQLEDALEILMKKANLGGDDDVKEDSNS